MYYIMLYVLLVSGLLGDAVVTINNTSYTLNDFYQEYGKTEWHDAKKNQQRRRVCH